MFILPATDRAEAGAYRFRAEARVLLAQRIAEEKGRATQPKRVVKKVQGGC